MMSSGCNRSRIFCLPLRMRAETIGTCTVTFTWQVATAPVFDNCVTETVDLGCNPPENPVCDPAITAGNECGNVLVDCSAGFLSSTPEAAVNNGF
ncbi:MAG: hypothetical protein IPM98_20275 [Lewinellaceae bacterium]|nr:hypothetical protein [Lewinellaceae bacterium]